MARQVLFAFSVINIPTITLLLVIIPPDLAVSEYYYNSYFIGFSVIRCERLSTNCGHHQCHENTNVCICGDIEYNWNYTVHWVLNI